MKKIYLTAMICIPLLYSGNRLFALESSRITYQGQLREDGIAVTAVKAMKFRIYSSSASGTALWTSPDYSVQVTSGIFRAALEPSGVNWESSALYLEVTVDNTTLSPREELTMSPLAINSSLHSGKKYISDSSAPVSSSAGDLWWDTSGKALFVYDGAAWQSASSVVGTNPWTRSSPNAFLQNSSDLVGIGTASPAAKLHVSGGSLQVGDGAAASSISPSGYVSLANLASAPAASRGRVFFDSTGAGALKISLDGASFVSIATGIAGAGGGMSTVVTNAAQFSGDGSGANPLTLTASSVTLQGNVFNSADKLVRLDSSGKLPALDAGALLRISSIAANAVNSDSQLASGINISQSKISNLTSDLSARLLKAGDTVTGDLQVGQASASTFSASGYIMMANRTSAPSASKGAIYFDSNGNGALKISLDGSGFVPLSTGSAGGGISSVVSNATQFSGDGNSGNALTLKPSSVTLQGNIFNAANSLLQLDSSALVPVANLGGLTDTQILAGANIAKSKISGTGTWALSDIPNLPAGQITSGTFGDSRVSVSTAAVTGNWELAKLSSGIMPANVVASSVAAASVSSIQIADGAIYGQDIALSTITLNRLNQSGCALNDIPKWNGSVWGCAVDVGVSSESDPKVGSLSSGLVPHWNGAALADGVIYDNAINVGIGTTIPAAKLEVAGGNIRALSQAAANNPSSGKGVEIFYDGSGNDRGRVLSVDRDVPVNKPLLLDGSSLALNAISGGNVGVGILSPGARLDVEGSAQFGSLPAKSTFTSAGVLQLASALGSAYGGTGADLSASAIGALPYFSASGVMSGLAAGTAGQILKSNGAAAPSWIDQSGLTVSTASNIAGGSAGTLPYQSGPGATVMLSTGTANQILQSNGAAAPSWTGAPSISGANIISIPESGVISLVSDLANRVLKTGDAMSGPLTLNGSSLTVAGSGFSVGGSTLVVINGNVGIGTTNPADKLQVESAGALAVSIKAGNTTSPFFDLYNGINYWRMFQGGSVSGSANKLHWSYNSNTPLVTIDTSGNVGIGTTNPSQKLDVVGHQRLTGQLILDGPVTTVLAQADDRQYFVTTSNHPISFGTNNVWGRLFIDTSGNVGIGTTNPGQKLSVAGTIESTSGGVKFPDGTVQPTAMGGAYASVYRTGVQSFAAVGTWYNVPMNNELSKVNITHSNATNPERVQVSAAGLYQITYTVNFKNTSTGASGSSRLVMNDTTEIAGTYQTTALYGGNYTAVTGATIVANLSANDYVTVQAGANDSTSVQVNVYTAGVTPTTASVATLTIVRLN